MALLRASRAALVALAICCCLGGVIAAAVQYVSRSEVHCVSDGDSRSCGDRFAGDVTGLGIAVGAGSGAAVWAMALWAARARHGSRRVASNGRGSDELDEWLSGQSADS